LTEWNEFKEVDLNHLKTLLRRPVVVDGRNVYDPEVMAAKGFQYAGMGRGLRAGKA
jgi:UDPglucose 6-dehydrogenase